MRGSNMSGVGVEIDMDAVVARLRASEERHSSICCRRVSCSQVGARFKESKERHHKEQFASGRENGREWAANTAETHELDTLRWFAGVMCSAGCVVISHDFAVLFPDFDFWEQVLGSSENLPSDAYIEGFMYAATEMLNYAEKKF